MLSCWLTTVLDSHNIYFIGLLLNPFQEALNCAITNCKLHTVQPIPYIQQQPPALPALPVPPEEPITIHHSTPATCCFPPNLACIDDVIALEPT